jgi:hypothetical protein
MPTDYLKLLPFDSDALAKEGAALADEAEKLYANILLSGSSRSVLPGIYFLDLKVRPAPPPPISRGLVVLDRIPKIRINHPDVFGAMFPAAGRCEDSRQHAALSNRRPAFHLGAAGVACIIPLVQRNLFSASLGLEEIDYSSTAPAFFFPRASWSSRKTEIDR